MSAAALKQTTAIIAPDPFGGRRVRMSVTPGFTISQIVAQAVANDNLPPRWNTAYLRAYVGGIEVPAAWWSRTRLKPGSHVAIIAAPQGGSTGKIFRTLLTVAVIALTAWVGAGALAGTLGSGFAGGTFGAAAAAAGVSIVGGVLLNALTPRPNTSSVSQTYSLDGASNAPKPYQPFPVVLGRRRVVPPLAAATYTETDGDDVYLNMMLAWHMGPCELSDIKIGETPITAYDGVTMQHRLLPTDSFPTLYPRIVREESLQLELTHAGGWVEHTTQRKTTTVSIDFGFPTGLTKNTSSGNTSATVQVHVQYRATGAGSWTDAPVGTGGVVTYTENKNVPFRRNISWDVDEGQYDIQISRVTADDDSTAIADDIYWVALRSLAAGAPVANDDLAITALRIKSSAQLNGVLDNVNAVVQMHAPLWDGDSGTFTGSGATRNPGEIANWLALGPANARPLTDRVDVARLGAWTERCAEKGWHCDYIIDNGGTLESVLQIVASAGRGLGALWLDGKLAVAVDDEQDAPVQIFSARTVANFTGTIAFPGVLHAVNVNFADEANGFQPATRTVFATGYSNDNATLYETIDAPAKTNADEAYVMGWRYLAGRTLRPEVYEFDTALQGLCVRLGDRADIAHYRLSVGITGARITGRQIDDDGNIVNLLLDETVTQEDGKTYAFQVQSGSTIQTLALTTVPGTSNVLELAAPLAPASAPGAGDHGVFGESGTETLPAIIIGIATKEGKDGHLTAIPYAPDLLADGGTIPDWDPLITPRALHGTPVGVHVPGNDNVTLGQIVTAINQERNDRAAGDDAEVGPGRLAETIAKIGISYTGDFTDVDPGTFSMAVSAVTQKLYKYDSGSSTWKLAVDASDLSDYTVLGSKVAIADVTNICTNPQFVSLADGTASTDGWSGLSGTTGVTVGSSAWPTGFVGIQLQRDVTFGQPFAVTPGQTFAFEHWATNANTGEAGLGLQVWTADGSPMWYRATTVPPSSLTPAHYSGQVTIPSGYVRARIWSQIALSSGFTYYDFTNVVVRKASSAELLVDGSVDANILNVDSARIAILSVGAISANSMLVDNLIITNNLVDETVNKVPTQTTGSIHVPMNDSGTTIATITATPRADNTPITISASGTLTTDFDHTIASVGVLRDGVPITNAMGTAGYQVISDGNAPGSYSWTLLFIDGFPSAGSHTYTVIALGSDLISVDTGTTDGDGDEIYDEESGGASVYSTTCTLTASYAVK